MATDGEILKCRGSAARLCVWAGMLFERVAGSSAKVGEARRDEESAQVAPDFTAPSAEPESRRKICHQLATVLQRETIQRRQKCYA